MHHGWADWHAIVELALQEDVGAGDITSRATVDPLATAHAELLVKQPGILSGMEAARYVFELVDPDLAFQHSPDSSAIQPGQIVGAITGNARSILAGERLALNLLQRLSGVATMTAAFVEAVNGTNVRIVDTRKTTPGLRSLEKQAVLHGGGHNHRFGLADGILIKDNHLAATGGPDRVTRAVTTARRNAPHPLRVEVEVTTVSEALEAVEAGADAILLDNMSLDQMREAVRSIGRRALIEASGGVTLSTVRPIAETGVDLISVGALTHSAPSLDISLDFRIG